VLGPIFTRELVTVPRRSNHYATRLAMIATAGVLIATTWQATIGFTREPTLGESARVGLLLFQLIVFVELLLLIFFAALSAASAVAQEKDRRTFILLLITDMRDYEIVLGKLVGSLLPIILFLGVSVPLLSILLILGGIDPNQVIQASVVLLMTACVSGSLGGLIALWRERTFQSLALSVILIALYLGGIRGIVGLGESFLPQWPWPLIQTCLDPFVAMQAVLELQPATTVGIPLPYAFALTMLGICILLNGIGIWKLRDWNPSGEPIMQREGPQADPEENMTPEEVKLYRSKAHAAPGAVRDVWDNPILWREIRTMAYGRRPLLIKVAFGVVLALLVWFAIYMLNQPGGRVPFAAAYGLVPLGVISLLLVAAQAVTSVTSERDGGALDVLLVTDVSPYEFVFGKLFGVIYNTKEYILPPLLLSIFLAIRGAFTRPGPKDTYLMMFSDNFGALIAVLLAIVLLFSFVMVLGLHVSLRLTNSRLAIVNTLGTVFFLSVGTLICIYLIIINGGSFANQWISFIAFLVLGIGGLLYVLSADRPSSALTLGSVLCPLAMFYCVTNILIAKPGTEESAEPLVPAMTLLAAFCFAISAMLVPLLSEFDVALGRTTAANEE
jgi:ABC-type Na+ efflux pump permease subunit